MLQLVSDFIAFAFDVSVKFKISPWTVISVFVLFGLFKLVRMYFKARLE